MVLGLVCALLGSGGGLSADELPLPALPADAVVFWRAEANPDGVPGNERIVWCYIPHPRAAVPAQVVVCRFSGKAWRAETVWAPDGTGSHASVELRDLDADGSLEIVEAGRLTVPIGGSAWWISVGASSGLQFTRAF